jgi:hypothetical protein
VSAAAHSRQEAPRRVIAVPMLLAATIVAVAGGAAIGLLIADDEADPPAAAPAQPRIGLKSGVAQLPLPPGWQPLGRRSSLPGFEQATAVRGSHGEVALDIRPPETASLLPTAVGAATPGGPPEPLPRRLGTRTLWRYDLAGTRPDVRVVALALPTTGGVVTIACGSSPAATAATAGECERAARSLQLDGASALTPAPEAAAAIVLPATAAQLNRRRSLERRRLAATRTPSGRSASARRLARAYSEAAARLRPVAAGQAARLTDALDALARGHRALAAASMRRQAARARRAGAAVNRGERRLGTLLAAVMRSAGRSPT